jgi:hypothetical protein
MGKVINGDYKVKPGGCWHWPSGPSSSPFGLGDPPPSCRSAKSLEYFSSESQTPYLELKGAKGEGDSAREELSGQSPGGRGSNLTIPLHLGSLSASIRDCGVVDPVWWQLAFLPVVASRQRGHQSVCSSPLLCPSHRWAGALSTRRPSDRRWFNIHLCWREPLHAPDI